MLSIPSDFPSFRFVLVRRPVPGQLMVRWAMNPHAYPMSRVRFELFRSQSPGGPWDLLPLPEMGATHFYDELIQGADHHAPQYYVVRAADVEGAGFRDSDVSWLTHDADNIAMDMIRKKRVFLRTRGGVPIAVLKKKRWGAKCGRCWDPIKKLPQDPDCLECFGTGYSGGFLNPVLSFALMQPPRKSVIAAGVEYHEGSLYIEMAPDPYVDRGDVLVDRVLNARFRVDTVQQATHRMHLVSQVCTLVRLDEKDPVYNISVEEPDAALIGESWMGDYR